MEYPEQSVMAEINRRAGNHDVERLLAFKSKADDRIRQAQGNLQSIVDIYLNNLNSQFLRERRDELGQLAIKTQFELEVSFRPQSNRTYDLEARQQGLRTPPHVKVLAMAHAIHSTHEAIKGLAEQGRQIEFHISRQTHAGREVPPQGDRVFLGHGRSPIWRELKDFIEDQLGLPVDEFNSVPTPECPTPSA